MSNDSASRVIHAHPERVFAALVDADALVVWLPPTGMTGRFERFDARPGGSFRPVLTYEDPSSGLGKGTPDSDIVGARHVEVVPNLRVRLASLEESMPATHAIGSARSEQMFGRQLVQPDETVGSLGGCLHVEVFEGRQVSQQLRRRLPLSKRRLG